MKKILLLVCVCLFVTCFVDAQINELNIADSFYKQGRYFEASVWYERSLYETREYIPEVCVSAINGKINCLKAEKRFSEAISFIARSRSMDIPDSFRQSLSYDEMLALYLNGNFEDAIESARGLDTTLFSFDKVMVSKAIIMLSLNELDRWQEAEIVYRQFLAEYLGAKVTAEQKDLYLVKPDLKSVSKAKLLATLFPGLGQVYAGNPIEGVANLLLQAGSLFFLVTAWHQGYYLTSLFIGGSTFAAFRSGGKRRASNLVTRHNVKIEASYNQYLKNGILSTFSEE